MDVMDGPDGTHLSGYRSFHNGHRHLGRRHLISLGSGLEGFHGLWQAPLSQTVVAKVGDGVDEIAVYRGAAAAGNVESSSEPAIATAASSACNTDRSGSSATSPWMR